MDLSQSEVQDSQELLEAFFDLLEHENDKLPENILLFGRSGAGKKSSVINTIHKGLTGKYFELAEVGRGETQTLTMELKR
jgi:predicted GTPase